MSDLSQNSALSSPAPITAADCHIAGNKAIVSLTWEAPPHDTPLRYELRFRKAEEQEWSTSVYLSQPGLYLGGLEAGTYKCQLRTLDSSGNGSAWTTLSFISTGSLSQSTESPLLTPGATLMLNDCELARSIRISDDKVIMLGTATFTSDEFLRLSNFSGSTAGLWTASHYHLTDEAYIGIEGTLYDATLSAAPDGFTGTYRTLGDVTIAADHCVHIEEGASLNAGCTLTVDGTLSADFTSSNHTAVLSGNQIVIRDGGSVSLIHADTSDCDILVQKGGVLTLRHANTHANITADKDAVVTLQDSAFSSLHLTHSKVTLSGNITTYGSTPFVLTDFNGDTDEIWKHCTFASTASSSRILLRESLQDAILTASPSGRLSTYFTEEALKITANAYTQIKSGCTLDLSGNLDVYGSLAVSSSTIQSGTWHMLRLHKGGSVFLDDSALTTGILRLENGAFFSMRGGTFSTKLSMVGGSALSFSGTTITMQLVLEKDISSVFNSCTFGENLTLKSDHCQIMGSTLLQGRKGLVLESFSGSTANIWSSKTTSITGSYSDGSNSCVTLVYRIYDAVLSATPVGLSGSYNVGYGSDSLTLVSNNTVTLLQGAVLNLHNDMYVDGTLEASFSTPQDAIRCDSNYQYTLTIRQGGCINLQNANIALNQPQNEFLIEGGGTLSMQRGSLYYGQVLIIENGASIQLEDTEVNSIILIREGTNNALKNCRFASSLRLSTSQVDLGESITFTGEKNFALYNFRGNTAELWDGVTVNAAAGSAISVYGKARNATFTEPPSGCGAYELIALNADSCSFKSDCTVYNSLTMTNCSVEGTLLFESGTLDSTLSGCDLSKATIRLSGDSGAMLNLSGNYWGTTDVEAIRERIIGYDASRVILGDVLATSPCEPKDDDFFFALNEPVTTRLENGKALMTFSWNADEDVTLSILDYGTDSSNEAGWKIYEGTGNSFSYIINTYYIDRRFKFIATDAAGNSKEFEDKFDGSAAYPSGRMSEPYISRSYNGMSSVSFNSSFFDGNERIPTSITLDGDLIYTDSYDHITCGPILVADGWHEYTMTAVTRAGEVVSESGSFFTDAVAPTLHVEEPTTSDAGAGAVNVTFRWNCDEAATCTLWVDGRQMYKGEEQSVSLTLSADWHNYTLEARDAGGNYTRYEGSVNHKNAAPLAPLCLHDARITRLGDDLADVTLSWEGEEGLDYTLTIDGRVIYRGTQPGCTLELSNGRYSYSLVATAPDGRSQTLSSELCVTRNAPALSLLEPTWRKAGEGKMKATLKWVGEKGCTYRVMVDGKVVFTGSKTSFALTLEDGEHYYSVTAINKQGDEMTCNGSFSADTSAPELLFTEPSMKKVQEGLTEVSFVWFCDEEITSTLKIDKQLLTPEDNTYTTILADGKHSYSFTGVDAAGNKVERKGSFVLDATSPIGDEWWDFSYKTAFLTDENEILQVLSWKKEKGVTYRVTYRDEVIYEGSNNTCKLMLSRGEAEQVLLTATDAAGNTREDSWQIFECKPTPVSIYTPRIVTLNEYEWNAKDVGKVHFHFEDDNRDNYTFLFNLNGKKSATMVNLKSGTHSYTYESYDSDKRLLASLQGHLVWDGSASRVHLVLEHLCKAGDGKVKAFFRWEGLSGSTYSLSMDGEEIYRGTETRLEHVLADGVHSYSLTAFHADGSSDTVHGKFEFDATAPALELKNGSPALKRGKGGMTTATFTWTGEPKANYVVMLGNEIIYSGSGKSCKVTLADGTHDYRIIAADARGNRSELSGSFSTDATAPKLAMLSPTLAPSVEKGKQEVTLHWAANEWVSNYTLTIGGKTYKDLTNTSQKVVLKDGNHSYTLTAMDAAGNTSTLKGKLDTLAPKLSLSAAKVKKTAEGEMSATLKWSGEKGASYMLSVDGGEAFTVEGTTYTLTGLRDGTHHYCVTATDAAGNVTTSAPDAKNSSFTLDASAPELILVKPEAAPATRGDIALSWSMPETEIGAKYTVKVNGKNASWNKKLQLWSIKLKPGTHSWTVTVKDAKGNTITRESTLVLSEEGTLRWVDGSDASAAAELNWVEGEAPGIQGRVSDACPVSSYTFRVDEAADLHLSLEGLEAHTQLNLLWLDAEGNTLRQYACEASALGLDRELALSAGNYRLQVESGNSSSILGNTGYSLNLALRQEDGLTRHAVLAAQG